MAWVGNRLQLTVELAGPDAHCLRNHSKGGLKQLRALRRLCKSPPRWKPISNAARNRDPAPDWRKETTLYLCTSFLDQQSAVSAGSTGKPIPTYLFPLDDKTIESINSWAYYYRGHDLLWIGSAKLEMAAYRELADPKKRPVILGPAKSVVKLNVPPGFLPTTTFTGILVGSTNSASGIVSAPAAAGNGRVTLRPQFTRVSEALNFAVPDAD